MRIKYVNALTTQYVNALTTQYVNALTTQYAILPLWCYLGPTEILIIKPTRCTNVSNLRN